MKESHIPIILLSIIILICIIGESETANKTIHYVSHGIWYIGLAYFIIKVLIKKPDNDKNK